MAPISASEIPSLSLLYKLNKLKLGTHAPLKDTSAAYNDRIGLFRGDITTLAVDAIVNAANTSLLGGGGVDGAIHRAAGPDLLDECRTLGGCPTGSSKITDAYRLPCNKVIHTVGPVYDDTRPARSGVTLRSCYRSSLELAVQNHVKTIAFSAISTGVYGYPSREAANLACDAVRTFLSSDKGRELEKVIFVTFEEKDVRAYNQLLPRYFPPDSEPSNDQDGTNEEQIAEAAAKAEQFPSVPATDPADAEHAHKKQKQGDEK
ncbi:MACRO domain-containing protein [Hypomontagnella monticulosa]|nr:MACRO domain-containing protein [Hypomontagnella monticulosa]